MQWTRLKLKEANSINKRRLGNEYEDLAVKYLEENNIKILERNFRSSFGEIDIIGKDKNYLTFIEVKYRKSTLKGFSEDAVNVNKIRKICKVSDYYRLIHKIGEDAFIRFDVLTVNASEITLYKNAFDYMN